jgi:hypothetical protein
VDVLMRIIILDDNLRSKIDVVMATSRIKDRTQCELLPILMGR